MEVSNHDELNVQNGELAPTLSSESHVFGYEGEGGALFVLYAKTFLLSIITLGIYSFWGKVEIQKYLFSKTKVVSRYFDYHATGKEKFIGFLIGSVIFAAYSAISAMLVSMGTIGSVLSGLLNLALVFLGMPYIIIASRRYLLSRSSWGNMRFVFKGEYSEFLKIFVFGSIISGLTLGLFYPVFLIQMKKFLTENSYLGDKAFSYDGEESPFFKLCVGGFLLSLVTLGIYAPFFAAKIFRYHTDHTRLGNSRFSTTVSGLDIFLVYLGVIFSFIIFLPLVINWAMNMFMSQLSVDLDPEDLKNIEFQEDQGASALADGLVDAGEVLGDFSSAF